MVNDGKGWYLFFGEIAQVCETKASAMMRACTVVLNAGVVGALTGALAFGCSLHPQGSVPGCRVDHPSDCEEGWQCRSGACVLVPDSGVKQDAADDVFEDGGEEAAVDSGLDAAADMVSDVEGDADMGADMKADVDEDVEDVAEVGAEDVSDGGDEDAGT